MTVAERVMTLIRQEDHGGSLHDKEPSLPPNEYLTEFELNLRDWGFVYGLCYALVRVEADPFESRSSIAEEALEQARFVWKWWGDWHGDERGNFRADREWRPVPEEALAS